MSVVTVPGPAFTVRTVDYAAAQPGLHAVREVVFVQEQGVPAELERDELDPQSHHVIAEDAEGRPIGTGRLTPERRIGRMAVLAEWRSRGVGDALLLALLDKARELGWHDVALHAQVSAIGFYARHGFLPQGERFVEAGIEHQTMRRLLDAANPVETHDAAIAALLGVIGTARRELWIYSRDLDPGMFDNAEVMAALRRFGTHRGVAHILLQDAIAPQSGRAPLIGLSQRLPSAFVFRVIEEPVDRAYAAAFVANDQGGWYFRTLGHRPEGETRIDQPARARQLQGVFESVWERARPCSEYRALGI
ncbi:GNAT family N-acetyltransferase [Lysobacter solisilvae (ex Woo and Kim 2020)]|uniref:GNAT family N-acetyltransferase n=1 Tax=Agrilutibacter terrestris TaxID=2865112 RepID=A0A7H0FXT4_9GAMM|nr:GNAT family N-acetyltransferase [Lysobacter terrestris]QNP40850.1 GNAT family N-acetyltransferase [Lysobacter terrestris]